MTVYVWMPWKRALSHFFAASSTQNIATFTFLRSTAPTLRANIVRTHNHNQAMSTMSDQQKTGRITNNLNVGTDATTTTTTTSGMTDHGRDCKLPVETIPIDCAIMRYLPGDERFQFKLTLRNGKVFNFDRSAADPLQTFIDRMVTNISKKVKTFEGNVVFLETPKIDDSQPPLGNNNWEKTSNSVPIEDLLEQLTTGFKKFNVQIGEDIYDIAINPPEIYAIKFLKNTSIGFPIFPLKIEASSNFQKDKSKYIWEFIPESEIKLTKVENRPKKNKGGGTAVKRTGGDSIWKDTGCRNFAFTPSNDLLGSIVRFTCIPSDGNGFGLPFSVELPAVVESSIIKDPLYLERLNRMNLTDRKQDLDFLRVVSYNCLADCYATEEWFIASPKGCLGPDFRLPFLIKEMESYEADLYCLQEVDDKYFEGHFMPFFNNQLNYKGVFSSKIGTTQEGVATFYNPKKFDLIRNDSVVIFEHMKLQTFWKSIISVSDEFHTRLQDRNTVLQVSIFKPTVSENTILIVANTHLYFHPDADHIRGLQTLTCVDYIEKTIDEMKRAFPTFRVALMFCGDFNCTPPFSSYRFLTTGKIEEDDEDWTSHSEQKLVPGISREHNLTLKNAHPGHELTNITTNFEGCIDYVLYQPENFELLEVYPTPDKSIIASITGVDEPRKVSLPNFHTPSDHLPLIADFLLKS